MALGTRPHRREDGAAAAVFFLDVARLLGTAATAVGELVGPGPRNPLLARTRPVVVEVAETTSERLMTAHSETP